ncbi:hypothetical protein PHSC3_000253 [Chlamydiales bacterium STE3]|nr:hypothetical protein PHSC3_000253 [Chlamydiales bacterium STE3]
MQPSTVNGQSGTTSSLISPSSGSQQSCSRWNTRTWSPSSSFQPRPFQPTSFQPRPFQPTNFSPTSYAPSSASPSPVINEESNFQSTPPTLDPSRFTHVFQEVAAEAPSKDDQKSVMQSLKKEEQSVDEDEEKLGKTTGEQIGLKLAACKQRSEDITSFYKESMKINELYSSAAFEIAKELKDATIASIPTGRPLGRDYLKRAEEALKKAEEIELAAAKQRDPALQSAIDELKKTKN